MSNKRKEIDLKSISKIFDPQYQNKRAFLNQANSISITYKQLSEDVFRFADKIQQKVNGRDNKILLFLNSGYSFVVSLFAVILTKNSAILVNTKLKEELKSLEFDYLISEKSLFQYFQKYKSIDEDKCIDYTNVDTKIINHNFTDCKVSAEDTLLYLYTSGSTGSPKLVEKTFENILVELELLVQILEMSENDVVLPLVPTFHIYGLLYAVFLPLYKGACIRLDIPFSPAAVIEDGIEKGVHYIIANPTILSALKTFLTKEKTQSRLKYIISSTMPLETEVIVDLYNKQNWKVLEFYGSTETGGIAYRKYYENTDWNFFSYIDFKLDEEFCLDIQSPGLSPHNKEWYSTGDIIEVKKDNRFSLMGRVNQLVKVAGNRVSTVEIENYLKKHPSIKDAVVIGNKAKGIIGEDLIAIIVLEENKLLTVSELKKYCKQKLADFKIPKVFHFVNQIPRGDNGKTLYSKVKDLIAKM